MYYFQTKEKYFSRKISMIMRVSTLLLMISMLHVSAEVYSQRNRLSLEIKDMTLKEAMKQIEAKTDYLFLYNSGDIKSDINLNINIKNQNIEKVLDELLKDTDLEYAIRGRHIILRPQKQAVSNEAKSQQGIRITGTVSDNFGELMPGVSVVVRGSAAGTSTDINGEFSLNVPGDTSVLQFRFLGYQMQEVVVGNRRIIAVTLQEATAELEEVVIVAFGKQTKESVISSIQTVNVKDLIVPSSNLTTAFAGRIAGVISYQTSGEPGYDDAEFFIRGITTFGTGKVNPLILVDNMEISSSDLAKIHPDDIASFSVLKDATATALYGARGANGVILVSTKEGREGKIKVSLRVENSWSQPTRKIEMAAPITYMQLANEAVFTRNPERGGMYTLSKIDRTERGVNPYVYPAVDWLGLLTKKTTMNQRANLNISGGGNIARYYIAGSFAQDNGILTVDNRNNFNNNINIKKYLLRSNINLNLTRSTEAVVRMSGSFEDYNGPIMGGNDLYRNAIRVSPVRFPAYYEPVDIYEKVNHILFGNFEGDSYFNPYAELMRGYRQSSAATMTAQLEFKQNFDQWVKGLSFRVLGNTTRYSNFSVRRAYVPYYYQATSYDRMEDRYQLVQLNPEKGTEYLNFLPVARTINSSFYGEAAINYNRAFTEKHTVSAMLVSIARNYISSAMDENTGDSRLVESLPNRNLGVSGRFTYGYDNRYFGEFNFGYNGSEKFDKGHRWGFFPSIGAGWTVSNESFWTEALKEAVPKLKLRATYGLVGNDDIGHTRFFYLSDVSIGGGISNFTTGYEYNGETRRGIRVNSYANPYIGWEVAYKTNIGIELGLLKDKMQIQADIFREHRTNILQDRADIPIELGLWETPQVNVGEATGKGIDVSVDYNQSLTTDAWMVARANFTYARSAYKYYEEIDYVAFDAPWKSRKGYSVRQQWGLVAQRLFIDEDEVAASTPQDYGEYMAGDIKYIDLNKDGVINELDQAPIGYPSVPEINYGFGVSAGYRNWDFSVFFSGSARSSFWIDANAMSPFVRRTVNVSTSTITGSGTITSTTEPKILEVGLARFIADDHWDERSRNPNSAWPRLSDRVIGNNTQRNTWFMREGAFLRLKSAEIGYLLPNAYIKKAGLASCRLYASGTNLWLWSKFKLWDVEMGSNGLGYPLQRVINLGINLTF